MKTVKILLSLALCSMVIGCSGESASPQLSDKSFAALSLEQHKENYSRCLAYIDVMGETEQAEPYWEQIAKRHGKDVEEFVMELLGEAMSPLAHTTLLQAAVQESGKYKNSAGLLILNHFGSQDADIAVKYFQDCGRTARYLASI